MKFVRDNMVTQFAFVWKSKLQPLHAIDATLSS